MIILDFARKFIIIINSFCFATFNIFWIIQYHSILIKFFTIFIWFYNILCWWKIEGDFLLTLFLRFNSK
ncbi:hypothetical protein EWH95_12395, partial [Enterococcus faecium]